MKRALFAYDYPESGTESVLRAVAKGLEATGKWEVTTMVTDGGRDAGSAAKDLSLLSYDVAHFWNLRAFQPFEATIGIPFGVTVHGFVRGAEQGYFNTLRQYEPDWIHCMDSFTQHRLGQQRLFSTITQQVISKEGFSPLPPPEEFTIGYTGDMADFDGFDVIDEIAVRANVRLHAHDASVEWIPREQMVERFFSKISVFVSWAFGACGPVTAQEALLCGRPVLTTPTETMRQILHQGWSGRFFNGSVTSGVKQLKLIQSDYQIYYNRALQTKLCRIEPVVEAFLAKWDELL